MAHICVSCTSCKMLSVWYCTPKIICSGPCMLAWDMHVPRYIAGCMWGWVYITVWQQLYHFACMAERNLLGAQRHSLPVRPITFGVAHFQR